MSSNITRTSKQLYRDCLRLIDHIAGNSVKGRKLRTILRGEFKKNADINDSALVEALKSNAIRGLSNYLMMESSKKDIRLQKHVSDYASNEATAIRSVDNEKKPT